VDIYDTDTGAWSIAKLSRARSQLSATSCGNKIFFGSGEEGTDTVDIYTLQSYGAVTSAKAWTLVDHTAVAGRMQLNSGASLNLDGYNLTVGSMSGVAPINLSTHALTAGTDNTDSTYSGQISGGGSLTKIGSGALILATANGYTGPTIVSGGRLVVNGSLASASAVTVQNGGALGGVGSVGPVTVNLGGHLAPGGLPGAIGTLTLGGNLSLNSGALLDFDLDAPTVCDLISMSSSTVTLDGQRFSDFTFTPKAGFGPGTYTLIDADIILGSLAGNCSGTIGGFRASISTGNGDLTLTVAVPEPSTLVLLGMGTVALAACAWRRRGKLHTLRSMKPL